mmetsp:Transcript_80812/g.223539  ORF Transcript_80812/g.223539 Transcript_80812/m.223539 type:complete len:230 (-) Transcript_80812:1704-2393(-)
MHAQEHAGGHVATALYHVIAITLLRRLALFLHELHRTMILRGQLHVALLHHVAIVRELLAMLLQTLVHLTVALALHVSAELHDVFIAVAHCLGVIIQPCQPLRDPLPEQGLAVLILDLLLVLDEASDGDALALEVLITCQCGLEGAEPGSILAAMFGQLRVEVELKVLQPLVRSDDGAASRCHLRGILLSGKALPLAALAMRHIWAELLERGLAKAAGLRVQSNVLCCD